MHTSRYRGCDLSLSSHSPTANQGFNAWLVLKYLKQHIKAVGQPSPHAPPPPPLMPALSPSPCTYVQNDVWALGVIALEAVSGCHPFSPDRGYCDGNVLYSIAHHSKVMLPPNLSPDFQDFLSQVRRRACMSTGRVPRGGNEFQATVVQGLLLL